MSLKTSSRRKGLAPSTTPIEFDFIVAERPQYIPGSGPPLAPITIMPADDKDGYIVGHVELHRKPHYIVGYQEQPHLRVCVRLQNILKWVSPRALEKWETEKYDADEAERERIELPRIRAKEERHRKKQMQSRVDATTQSISRKRKRHLSPDPAPFKMKQAGTPGSGTRKVGRPRGPASRNQPVEEEEEVTFKSPRQSRHSQQQPSLTAPGHVLANRTVLDTDSEDELSMDPGIAIEQQLNDDQTSRDESRDVSLSGFENSQRHRPHDHSSPSRPGEGAVVATSSREALKLYQDLERKPSKRPLTLAEKYSLTKSQSQSITFEGSHIGLAVPSRSLAQAAVEDEDTDSPEEDEDQLAESEPEYEVNKIIRHETRYSEDGKPEEWYLINWVGDWDDTWEPAENIGEGAIADYKEMRKRTKRFRGSAPGDGEDDDPDSLFVSQMMEVTKKAREVSRGQIVDDDDNDDDDDEELY